ncbi:MAG TPA: carbohydrate ABC transporter permease [Mycobacteriales bacterium]|jgi:multiple sugar transport system permease protein|nr:carbohydrate ABC transporter permease [Mycobacteriales bacterium]
MASRGRRSPQALLPRPVQVGGIALVLVLSLVPVLYMLLLSVTPDAEVTAGKLWPSSFAFDNYVKMWSATGLAKGIANSAISAGTAAVAATALAMGAGFFLARYVFVGRRAYLYSLIGMQAVPQTMLLLPLFAVYASVQTALSVLVIGSRITLIITYLTFAIPFATWVMLTYIQEIPRSLEEAARVDGTSHFGAMWRITLPLCWPGLVVALVFSFLLGWNDVLFASVLTNPGSRTVAISLQVFNQSIEGGGLPLYGQLMGASVISALPVVILYMTFQRYLLSGLTAGGVKG